MRLSAAALLSLLLATPALAQQAPADPIGALLARPTAPGQATPELDEPDTAAEPPGAPQPEPQVALPAGPQPYQPAPKRPQLSAPVYVNETGKTPDAPPSVRDMAYDTRIKSSFASAEAFQGPLDGAWTLSAADGAGLYELKLVDKGQGVLEGAWRDLRRPGALDASGFIDEISRDPGQLTFRFSPGEGAPVTATFKGGYGGAWNGQLEENGQRRTVSLRKAPA